MKGKNVFSKQEAEQIERLISQRCSAESSQQKKIRDKMRAIGFYGSDYRISDMTIPKFHQLIESKQIEIIDGNESLGAIHNVPNKHSHTTVVLSPSLDSEMKHGLAAWVGDDPRVLILGTFPGEKSLKSQAYYQDRAHNSFYKIMESLFYRTNGISDKDFLIEHHIALWDCMKEANREGSIDANITKYIPNKIEHFLFLHPSITTIILNGMGKTRDVFFKHFNVKELSRRFEIKSLPSTANTNSIPFEDKLREWKVVKNIIIGK